MIKDSMIKGTTFAILGGACWAISNICGQYIFDEKFFDAQWYVTARLQGAGILLMIVCYKKYGKAMFNIWKEKKDALSLAIYGIITLMGVQFAHFLAIQYCNAATATVIMYLSPAIVLGYVCFRDRQKPTLVEVCSVFLAIVGVFLLITHGNISTISMTTIAVFWSLVSAALMALYSIQPKRLLDKWGSLLTNGWGMFLGGIAIGLINPVWKTKEGILDGETVFFMTAAVVIGTVLAFYLYLDGMRIIGSKKASVYACAEPLFTAILGIFFLKIEFLLIDWIGALMIISTVVILVLAPGKKKDEPVVKIQENGSN